VCKMRGKHAIDPQAGLAGADRDSFDCMISHGSSNVWRN
jgi:hypothetical protein